jgi:hypothetical protein
MDFKFLTNNDVKIPRYYTITEEDIARAISLGREHYLNGHNIEDNPYHTPELFEAFNEGWNLEQSYDTLRQSLQRAINGL